MNNELRMIEVQTVQSFHEGGHKIYKSVLTHQYASKDGRYIFHRIDGPAIVYPNGEKNNEWWFFSSYMRPEFYQWAEEMGIDLDNLQENELNLIHMKWLPRV